MAPAPAKPPARERPRASQTAPRKQALPEIAPAAPVTPTEPAGAGTATAAPATQPAAGDDPDEEDEPLVPGAPSSLVVDRRAGRARAVATPEDEFSDEVSADGGLRAGDLDVRVSEAFSVGDETPGGDNPTPDQDVVDLIGRSLGVEYDDEEELKGADKIAERDRHRWELDPASAEDYKERSRT